MLMSFNLTVSHILNVNSNYLSFSFLGGGVGFCRYVLIAFIRFSVREAVVAGEEEGFFPNPFGLS